MTMTHRILVVEDEPSIAELIAINLTHAGYQVEKALQTEVAMNMMRDELPSLLILDWMLPGKSGVQFARELRANERTRGLPILMLTARIDELDRLQGLDTGADDYVCKPFAPREVVALVRALLRRASGKAKASPQAWVVDDASFRIRWMGQWLPLTRIEFMMFRTLLARPGRVFSREQLLTSIHDSHRDISDRAVDTHIKTLRAKLRERDPDANLILTHRGLGYSLELA